VWLCGRNVRQQGALWLLLVLVLPSLR